MAIQNAIELLVLLSFILNELPVFCMVKTEDAFLKNTFSSLSKTNIIPNGQQQRSAVLATSARRNVEFS